MINTKLELYRNDILFLALEQLSDPKELKIVGIKIKCAKSYDEIEKIVRDYSITKKLF